jgi:hypothetical protein
MKHVTTLLRLTIVFSTLTPIGSQQYFVTFGVITNFFAVLRLLCSRLEESKEDDMDRTCSIHEKCNECRALVVKPDGKRPLERPRLRLEYNI